MADSTRPKMAKPSQTYIARLKSKLGRSVRHGHSQVPLTDIESGEGAAGVAPRAAAPAGGDAETGWDSIQPDPNPPFVSLSSTVRLLGCPGAMECGQLCTRLPIFCLFGIFIAPAVYFLGLAAVLVLLLLVLCLGCPCGIALAWLFPRCWPGFKPPSEVAWKAAKALQTLRVVTYTNPKPAEWNAEQLADKRQLKTALLRYAIAIRVPVSAEQESLEGAGGPPATNGEDGGFVSTAGRLFELLPTNAIDTQEPFAAGEDPVAYVMDSLRWIYPPIDMVWPEKTTDLALTWFCVNGLGAHRIESVPAKKEKRGGPDLLVPEEASFVVRTNFLSQLTVKDGCDTYGGDCYLDALWRPLCIVRQTQVASWEQPNFDICYPPNLLHAATAPADLPEPPTGWDANHIFTHDDDVGTVALAAASAAGLRAGNRVTLGEPRDWEYFKFVFRSSLFGIVTLVDHLYGVHLQVSNIFTMAMREQLSKDTPLRRFLVPFTYGTIAINDAARVTLVTPDSWVPRAYPFDEEGLQLAWAGAYRHLPGGVELKAELTERDFLQTIFDREAYINMRVKSGVDTQYYKQAREYWRMLRAFVKGTFDIYYPTPADKQRFVEDAETEHFLLQAIGGIQATSDVLVIGDESLPHAWESFDPAQKYTMVVNAITRFIDVVTTGHEQVGKVQAYAQDASFASFSWAASLRPRWAGGTGEGVLAAPKEVATGQALIMALTSTPMPDLVAAAGGEQDWSKIFWAADGDQRAQLDEVYVQFQDSLRAFSVECQEVNESALAAFESGQQNVAGKPLVNFGLWSHDPQYLETSVSI